VTDPEQPTTTPEEQTAPAEAIGARWNDVLYLLRSHPGEFLPDGTVVRGQEVRTRERLTDAAQYWANSDYLTEQERERIRAVWLEGRYIAPLSSSTQRTVELGALHAR
jgi:hypothetical protein